MTPTTTTTPSSPSNHAPPVPDDASDDRNDDKAENTEATVTATAVAASVAKSASGERINDVGGNESGAPPQDDRRDNQEVAADAAVTSSSSSFPSARNVVDDRRREEIGTIVLPADGEAVVVCIPTTSGAVEENLLPPPSETEEAKSMSDDNDHNIPQDSNEQKRNKGGNGNQNVNRSGSVATSHQEDCAPSDTAAAATDTTAPFATLGIKHGDSTVIDEMEEDIVGGDEDNSNYSKREEASHRPLSDDLGGKRNSTHTEDEATSVLPTSCFAAAVALTNEVKVNEESSKDGTKGQLRDDDGVDRNDLSSGILREDAITKKKNEGEGGLAESSKSVGNAIVVADAGNADVPMIDATFQVIAMDEGEGKATAATEMGRFRPKRPKRLSLPLSSSTLGGGDAFNPTTLEVEDPEKEEAGSVVSIVGSSSGSNITSSLPQTIISPQEYHLRFCLFRKRRQITKDMRKLLMKIPPPGSSGAAAASSVMGGSSNASDASTIRSDSATVARSNRANEFAGVKFPTPTSYNSNPSSGDASSISRSQVLMGRDLPLPFPDSRDGQQLQRRGPPTSDGSDQVLRSQHNSASGRACGAAAQGVEGGRRRSSASDSLSFDNASAGGGSCSGGSFPLGYISPAPFKVVMTKEHLDKMSGCTTVEDQGTDNQRNLETWERIMSSMTTGNNSRKDTAGQVTGEGGGERQAFNELTTPSSSMKRAIDEVFNAEYDKNSRIGSLLRKRSIDHVLQGGDAGMNIESHPSKSPLPKKSFLQRERIMDEVMRSYMKETLEDLQNSHHSLSSQLPSNMSSHFSTPGELRNHLPHAGMVENIKNLMLPLSSDSIAKPNPTSEDGEKETSRSAESKKSKTKKSQKASDTAILTTGSIPQKPRRPFSAYNLFFQLEREFIMNELSEGRKPAEDPLIKRAMLKLEEGLIGADEENDESLAEIIVETEPTNTREDDQDIDTTDDLAATDRPDKDGDTVTCDELASTDLKEDDGEATPIDGPASTLNKPEDNHSKVASKQDSESKYFDDPEIPPRYSHLRLDKYWYSVSHKQKRKHRKTEGSCSFMELTTMVSARWKIIDKTDPNVKKYCQKLALMELNKYKEEIATYKSAIKAAEKESDALRQQSKDAPTKGMTRLKKKGRNNKKVEAEDRSSPLDPETRTEFGRGRHSVDNVLTDMNSNMIGGTEMNRLMELARMGGPLQGAHHAHLGNSSGSGGGSGGLPPPPFSEDSFRNSDDRVRIAAEARMNNRARLAAELAEARMAEARLAAGMANGRDPVHEAAMMEAVALAEARSYGTLPDDRRMFHAHEAQSRMAPGAFGYDHSAASSIQRQFAALAEAEARHRMQLEIQLGKLGHRNMAGGGWSNYDDGLNFPRNEFDMYSAASHMSRMSQGSGMPYNDNFLGRSGGFPPYHGDPRSGSLQRKFMELSGLSDGRIPPNLPNPGSQNFEMEVEHFLSNLGQEIRRNRQKFMDGADEGGSVSDNYGMARMGDTSRNGMRMDDPMGMRAEMFKQMMMGSGNAGGSSSTNSGGNTSPRAMAEMLMMRKQVAEASQNNFGMTMSGPSFQGDESPTQRGTTEGGDNKGGARGGDDDNPSLPEYGWGHNGPR